MKKLMVVLLSAAVLAGCAGPNYQQHQSGSGYGASKMRFNLHDGSGNNCVVSAGGWGGLSCNITSAIDNLL